MPYETEMKRLREFLKEHKLTLVKLIAKGHSSFVFLVRKGDKKLVAKLERKDSTREGMIEKAVANLKKANA